MSVAAIILAQALDFGRCPVASRVPTALWPVVGQPALRRLLVHLVGQGIRNVTICSNGDSSLLAKAVDIENLSDLELSFLDEPLPVGTAGSIRDTAKGHTSELFLVLPAGIVRPPDVSSLITAHREQESDLTVVFNPGQRKDEIRGEPANIYVCNPSVLECIPTEGYYDIKESLIPEMIRLGKRVRCTTLPHSVGNFHERQAYLDAIGNYLEHPTNADISLKKDEHNGNCVIWKGSGVTVDSSARIYGKVVLLDGVSIEAGAVIFGPTVLGRNVKVGSDSVIVNSVLWDDSQVGDNGEVQRSIIDYRAIVPDNSIVTDTSVVFMPEGKLKSFLDKLVNGVKKVTRGLAPQLKPRLDGLNRKLPNWTRGQQGKILPWLAAGFVLIAFLWSYWSGILDLWSIWQRSDEYSSGVLVPFLAVYILWSRRNQITGIEIKPSLWGLPAFLGAQALRFFGLFFMYGSAERLSVVLSGASLALLLLGWNFFKKVSPIILFMFLMLPWPNQVQSAIALPLQQWSTSSAVFCLEMIGYEVVREGNVIHIGQASVAVAEACNGLRMITAFFVISGLVVLLVNRPWWEKLVVFASSLPIALFCNTVRLAVTAIAFTMLEGEYWEKVFHDFGGYAMMPLALALIVAEFWFLAKLTMAPKTDSIVVTRSA